MEDEKVSTNGTLKMITSMDNQTITTTSLICTKCEPFTDVLCLCNDDPYEAIQEVCRVSQLTKKFKKSTGKKLVKSNKSIS